jgi:hypothetical protein
MSRMLARLVLLSSLSAALPGLASQTQSVEVTNPPSSPVPVAVTNAAPIAVTVSNPTSSVTLSNPNPIQVHVAGAPGEQRVLQSFSGGPSATTGGLVYAFLLADGYTVPAGKRLVLEQVSAQVLASAPAGGLSMVTTLNVVSAGVQVVNMPLGGAAQPMLCTGSQQCVTQTYAVHVYVNAGETVYAPLSISTVADNNLVQATATLSGYLVDAP